MDDVVRVADLPPLAEILRMAIKRFDTQDARIAELEGERDALRADSLKLADSEVVNHCEGCGAWLLPDDDYVSDPDGIPGCWAAMTDLPSKRERPCYAYRVGKPDARAHLVGGAQ